MGVTIKDVAKKANVSPSTVSRVLADSPKISEKTKQHVRKVIDELGYHANLNARSLVRKRTQTIGIVLKNSDKEALHSTFAPEVLRGISAICSKYGYSIRLTTGESEEEIFQDVEKMVQGKQVDGIIVLYSKRTDHVVPYLVEREFPFVIIGKPAKYTNEISYVDNDNIQAAMDATNYLIEKCHKRIAFISDDPTYEVAQKRLIGYKQAMQMNHLDVPNEYIHHLKNNYDEGYRLVKKLMSLPEPPTGIVVTDDFNALIVLSVLHELNFNVPNDVSLISFNNSVIADVTYPKLTSVDIQIYQLGFETTQLLIKQLNEPEHTKKSVIIHSVIEERNSCKSLCNHQPK
ncbi:LacI family DNA-binding transcriptional regulator [Pallidibacillus pasinlerensis]|uniref:LacI family transcriptional regulator n=1 Tax=Pallidibacillus pasinlerensis TaxID=2703818 RepID=A0ABX0A9T5_9BACI|nr:LacI family DNA-binding transcriptional regulator [Pallidibacillus pasinlerensis]NCU18824.1 LacI family transcriptional regulator [Pallidibacillus pasinlerensis]